jgi:ubiquinone/menaquinone biosynthesis C-methylase UbiE
VAFLPQETHEPHGPHGGHGHSQWHDYDRLARLLDPSREEWFPRARILSLLALTEGMYVADVGAGSGYMASGLATAVGQAGRVTAVDPSPSARQHLLERRQEGPFPQLDVREGTAEDTGLPAASCDRMLWQAIYHELRNNQAAWAEARRVLKPDGRLVVVDWSPVESPVGPPVAHRISAEVAETQARANGFRVTERLEVSTVVWALVLQPA